MTALAVALDPMLVLDSARSLIVDRRQAGTDRRFLKAPGPLFRRASGIWVPRTFVRILSRAREIRADFTFGEEILDIADNTADDRSYNRRRPPRPSHRPNGVNQFLPTDQQHLARPIEHWAKRANTEIR